MPVPIWLDRLVVDAIHLDQLREHGGLRGLRDESALESALARPLQKHHYEPDADLAALAASYGAGLCRNHPYNDGNKRIAFLAMVIILGLNGLDMSPPETEVVTAILSLASGNVTEEELAAWVRRHTQSPPSGS